MKVSLMLVLVLLLYLVSSIGHLYVMLTDRRKLFTFVLICLISGFVIHGVLLASSLSLFQSKGVGFWFSGISWVILLFYLLLYAKYKEIAFGGFAVPVAFIIEGYASTFPGVLGGGSSEIEGYLLKGHAYLAVLGMAAFFLLMFTSIMYIIQSSQLKSRRPGAWLHRLPSLNVLDNLGHKILYFGFTFLTFSLLLGSMWARSKHGTFWSLDPLSLVRTWPLAFTWLAYGLLLVCRITRSWKGMRSAIFSMFCFVCVIFSLLSHF